MTTVWQLSNIFIKIEILFVQFHTCTQYIAIISKILILRNIDEETYDPRALISNRVIFFKPDNWRVSTVQGILALRLNYICLCIASKFALTEIIIDLHKF